MKLGVLSIALLPFLALMAAKGEPAPVPGIVVTNVLQARQVAAGAQSVACSPRLEGAVLWVAPEADQFIMEDASAGIPIEMDLRNQPRLQIGQKVRVEGTAAAGNGRIREALINNDGLHSARERSEMIYLRAGRHPVRVDWFNGPTEFRLDVNWEGPGVARQKVPDAVLSDLIFNCYEGRWRQLPNFAQLAPNRSGSVTNFDLGVRTRDDHVAIQYNGSIQIPREGTYTFWLNSDDGSRLYLDGPALQITPMQREALDTIQNGTPHPDPPFRSG